MSARRTKIHILPAPKNKDDLWSVVCHMREFTLPDITAKEGVSLQTIRRHISALVKSGHLTERRAGLAKMYTVIISPDSLPNIDLSGQKKQPTGRQRMWMGMKAKRVFDYKEVSLFASVPAEAARQYCYALRKAGYLIVRREAAAPLSEVYQFNPAKDSGLHAPQITRDKKVYDRNLGRVVWPESEGK